MPDYVKWAQFTLEGVHSPRGPSKHCSFVKYIVRAHWYASCYNIPYSGVEAQGEWTHHCGRRTKARPDFLHLPQLQWRGFCYCARTAEVSGPSGRHGRSELPRTSQRAQRYWARAQSRRINMGITSHITQDYGFYQGGNTPAHSHFNNHLRTGCNNYQTKLKARRTF